MIGAPTHHAMNRRLAEALGRRSPLIAVHRGVGTGSIPENTGAAVTAALRCGGDMIELDVVSSADGQFFLFHNGYELRKFGVETDIRTLRGDEIAGLRYVDGIDRDGWPRGVVTLAEVLLAFPEQLFNLDRSWDNRDRLLPYLDHFPGSAPGLVLKAPVRQDLLDLLAGHDRKYPFISMVDSEAAAEAVLAMGQRINLVGMELLPDGPDHALAGAGYVSDLHDRSLLMLLNAMNLGNGRSLFLGWDDELSVLDHPDKGWGRLMDHGADIIQTDWPWLLAGYRADRTAQRRAAGSDPAAGVREA